MAQPGITDKFESQQRSAKALPLVSRIASALPGPIRASASESSFIVILVALYVFLLESRVLDLSPIWWMHIPMVVLATLIVLTLAKGQLHYTFQSKISIVFGLFTIWVALCVPLSEWRAVSIGVLQGQIMALVIFVIIVQAIRTPAAYRRVTSCYAYAILVASIMSFFFGRSVENGRLALALGTLGDPNEYALALIIGLPFWWDKANAARGPKKIIFLLCTIPIFISFGRTGSRSGLITLAVLILTTFFLAPMSRKLIIAIGCAILVLAGAFLLPEYITARFQTIFTPADAQDASKLKSDIASSEGRKGLLFQSIHMTFEHPMFGVGPGVFSSASWDERKAQSGAGGLALQTHNTYTQISSETGFPGFILFVITVGLVLKSGLKTYRALGNTDAVLATSGKYLFSMNAAASVGIFFLSVGYTHTVSTLFALAVALDNLRQKLAAEAPAHTKAAVSYPANPFVVPKAVPAMPVTTAARAPLANSKAIRSAGLANKSPLTGPAVRKSS